MMRVWIPVELLATAPLLALKLKLAALQGRRLKAK
jgi:hypothetical protein